VGAAPGARVRASQPLEGRVNYLRGPDPSAWTTDVPTFGRVTTEGVYPGIDLTYYGRQGQLEYDFVVAPGADPGAIEMEVEGADSAHVDEQGDLVLEVGGAQLRQPRPVVYQPDGHGSRRAVSGGYAVEGANRVRFALGAYDVTRAVVIDPVLIYSTYLGGAMSAGADTSGNGIAVSAGGEAFVTGQTSVVDFPTTPGALDTTFNGGPYDAFVTKLNAAGSGLVYSTYLGGAGNDLGTGIAVDASGAAYVTGMTESSDFPATPGAFDTTFNGGVGDVFVAKLSATGGGLVYATFLGGAGTDEGSGIAVDAAGSAYVAGSTVSSDFPTTPGAFDTTLDGGGIGSDAFATKVSAAGDGLAYSTFLGGSFISDGAGIAADASGAAYVTGRTSASNFPTTPGAFDTTFNGAIDAFVTKLNASGSGLAYSTFLGGGPSDDGAGIAVDATGAAHVVGSTASSSFPTTPGAYDTTFNGSGGVGGDAFVTKLNAAGSGLAYSTFLGGTSDEFGYGIALDAGGVACVTGTTSGSSFPTTAGAFDRTFNGGASDAFVAKLSAPGSGLVYSTYLGGFGDDRGFGIAADATGAAYITGTTRGMTFPTTPGAFDTTFNGGEPGGSDAFVTKVDVSGSTLAYSTFIGGAFSNGGTAEGLAVAVDASGAAYVSGETISPNFPTTPGAFDTSHNSVSGFDAFVTKLNAEGTGLVYSTFLGGVGHESGTAIAVDATGAAYISGSTGSTAFPTTPGAFDTSFNGFSANSFVTKLNAAGSGLVYSTFLGAGNGAAIVVDATGAAYVVGLAGPDFPTTPGAFDTTFNGHSDAFVTKLNAAGSGLVYSTFLGGGSPDDGAGIAVDASGAAYVAGSTGSPDFPTTSGAFDTTFNGNGTEFAGDVFVAKLSAAGSGLVYSTFLGGAAADTEPSVAVDASGAAYVTGLTRSTDFPTTPGAFDTSLNGIPGGADAFVTKVRAAGSGLVYSTYLGGAARDVGTAIAVDADGAAYVSGRTSSQDYPTTPDGLDPTFNGFADDAFVTRLSPSGDALDNSTFLGGARDDVAEGIALGPLGVYAVGSTTSLNFPTVTPVQPGLAGAKDAFVLLLDLDSESLGGTDTAGVYIPSTGAWFLRNENSPGGADLVFTFGAGGSVVPITGDWDGDGVDTAGLSDPATGVFFLRNANAGGGADLVFTYGAGGAGLIPLSGDWDGDGVDTVGIYDPATGAFFLTNANAPGPADLVFTFGVGGAGTVPLAGDWNGDGIDTVGVYDPGSGAFFLKNANAGGGADAVFTYGAGGQGFVALAGDWNTDGVDSVGLAAPATRTFFLKNANAPGAADLVFPYGPPGATPIVGDWDGL
jgi:hypothetical protein